MFVIHVSRENLYFFTHDIPFIKINKLYIFKRSWSQGKGKMC